MAQPTASDVHVNRPLTNISIAFMQDQTVFVADQVFPNVPVEKQSDVYYEYDRHYFNRDEMEVRAPATESAGGHYTVDATPNYYAPVFAFHHDIDDQRRANTDNPLNPDREATDIVTTKGLIKREKTWAAGHFASGIWDTDMDGVAAGPVAGEFLQWNDAASTPVDDVEDGKATVLEATGFEPNTLVVGYAVWKALKRHPDVVDLIKYGQTPGSPAVVTLQALAQILELERILVMKAVETTTAEGAATQTSAFIGGKKALLCYSAPNPGLMVPSAGYTFSWTGYLGAGGQGQRISKFRIVKEKSDRVEIEMAYDQKVIASVLGYFFDTAVA